eukprot:m.85728 g.85728  ORF g.85728 m.85728 type:complete len:332 (-) comp14734_c0_seq1:235-1230(-)
MASSALITCDSNDHTCTSCTLASSPPNASTTPVRSGRRRGKRAFLVWLLLSNLLSLGSTVVALWRDLSPSRMAWLFALGSSIPVTALLATAGAGRLYDFLGDDPLQRMPVLYLVVFLSAIGAILVSPIQVLSPATLALLSILSWWAYDQWYAKQDLSFIQPFLINRGSEIPAFLLQDAQGRDTPSDSLFVLPLSDGSLPSHLVMVFFRGNWCGVCMAQLARFRKSAATLADQHVRIVLVSTQPLAEQQKLASTFSETDNITVLHDPEQRVTKAWGLVGVGQAPVFLTNYPSDAAIPTTLLVSKNWRLQASWLSRDYRSRAMPEQVLKALIS